MYKNKKLMMALGIAVTVSSLHLSILPAKADTSATATLATTVIEESIEFEQLAKEFIDSLNNGKEDAAYILLHAAMKEKWTKEELLSIWKQFNVNVSLSRHQSTRITENQVHTNVHLTYETTHSNGQKGQTEITVRFTKDGKIDDLYIPAFYFPNSQYKHPSYDQPAGYEERQVKIGEGEFSLPGTLTVPKGNGPFPVVVLIHGSGANNQDEEMYSLKPFRDMAVGLAKNGIATLRYDKRTFTHPLKSYKINNFSVREETIDDALLAVELLTKIKDIDSNNIFVLGHSQGGMLLPAIVNADQRNGNIKGGIMVAAPTGNLADLIVLQEKNRLELARKQNAPKELIEQMEAAVQYLEGQVALLKNPDYSKDNIPEEFTMGDAYWWYDFLEYDAVKTAQQLTNPLLVMQGGKDIQVFPYELENWKQALGKRTNVDYQYYPDLTHFLVNFKGEPTGEEYAIPANVPENFVQDIAKWVKSAGESEQPSTPTIDPAQFFDFKENQYWSKPMEWALNEGIIKGYKNEKILRPMTPMTEGQFLTMLFRFIKYEDFIDGKTDVYDIAKKLNLPVTGKHHQPIRRGSVAHILAEQVKGKPLSEKEAVQWFYEQNLSSGFINNQGQYPKTYESFKPNAPLKRAEAVSFLYRMSH
ncbi:MAG TPA: alpha/beta fold hydrolase [Chondromyces sp.]|nr:alpha/beta fold hydrolase [Chondromyces sp.]